LTTRSQVFDGSCDAVHNFGAAYTVAFSPGDGRQFAAGSGGAVPVWDWRRRQPLHPFAGHQKRAVSVAFSRDGRRVVTGGESHTPQIWDVETSRELETLEGHMGDVCAVAFKVTHQGSAFSAFQPPLPPRR
jgi:eukaryotic-like serine/threonine-protein kinase